MSSRKLCLWFISALAFALLVASVAPRALSFLPGLAGLAFYALDWKQGRQRPPLPRALLFACGGLLVLGAASAGWAPDPARVLERSVKTALVILPCCLLFTRFSFLKQEIVREYGWIIPAAIAAVAFIIAEEMLLRMPLYHIVKDTVSGHLVRPHELNRTAIALSLCLIPAAWMAWNAKGRHWLLAGMMIPMLVIFLKTESQSVQVALLIGVFFTAAFPYRSRFAWGLLGGILCGGIAFAPWLATGGFALLLEKGGQLPVFGGIRGANIGARLEIWDFVSRYALQNPLVGSGMDATRGITSFDTAQLFHHAPTVLHPHNFALQFWIEFGVIGAAAGIVITIWLLSRIYRMELRGQRIALPVFIACFATAAFTFGMWQGWWIGLLFLTAALSNIAIKEKAPS